jgi:hypothetical protein
MVFAFLESLVIFLMMVLLGYLISARWDQDRRIALLTYLVLIAALWAIIGQLFFLLEVALPGPLIDLLAHSDHPLRVLYGAVFVIVTLSVFLPALLVMRSERAFRFMRGLIERVSLLTTFYLFFDVVGVAIVIIRNL